MAAVREGLSRVQGEVTPYLAVPGDQVGALLFGWLDVGLTFEIRVNQRAVAAPVLGRGVGFEDPGHATYLALALEQRVRLEWR